jgi:hypothetical protein
MHFYLCIAKKLNLVLHLLLAATTEVELLFPKMCSKFFCGSYSEIKECALGITAVQDIVLHQETNGS